MDQKNAQRQKQAEREKAYARAEMKRGEFVESIHKHNAQKAEYMKRERRAREVMDPNTLYSVKISIFVTHIFLVSL